MNLRPQTFDPSVLRPVPSSASAVVVAEAGDYVSGH